MTESRFLKGVKWIRQAFDLSERQFYAFVNLGMPINGTVYGHYQIIDEWLQSITDPRRTKKRELNVDLNTGFQFTDDELNS